MANFIHKSLIRSPIIFILLFAACARASQAQPDSASKMRIIAVEPFLADMAQNVVGDRYHVDSLIPPGIDPHAFEPTPADIGRLSDSDGIILNGAGLESWLDETLASLEGSHELIIASQGLTPRRNDLLGAENEGSGTGSGDLQTSTLSDPHFWLDPVFAVRYVENIRDRMIELDPDGKEEYKRNAQAYIAQLQTLNEWIADQVNQVPPISRVLVTNHESLGYFADRYGFKIVGTILPSTSSQAAPSGRQIASLIESIRKFKVKAVFLETGSNLQLAQQISLETGVRVVDSLFSDSLSASAGPAPTYLDLMRHNTSTIVNALK